jgi:putative ABC transport system ATP-binding protein
MDVAISQLIFTYPNRTFRLSVPALQMGSGRRVAFVGPSGSGKTTLLRLISGIHLPDAGSVVVGGVQVSALSDRARREFRITRTGFVFQDFQLIEYLNVEENIRLPFRIHRALNWGPERARRLRQLTEATGIEGKLRRRVGELSQGEKQRVAICRALLPAPRLVLADEPTGNLDPAAKHRILDLLFQETGRLGATLVMVTHDQELLRGFQKVIDFATFHSTPA